MAVIEATVGSAFGRVARRLDRLSERGFAVLVSVPGLILLALIVLPPTLAVFGLSLFRMELAKDDLTPFVGLRNYLERLPADQVVLDAIPRTVSFAAITTAITLPLALVTALVLNRGFRGASIFFVALLMPWAISAIVAGIFWRFIFDTHFGIVNGVMIGLGLIDGPINWLKETAQAVTIAIVAQSWRSVPLLAVLVLAALRTIPSALYRAAKMDGATAWESFRYITLPAIRPTLIVVGILQVIIGLQVFDLLYSLTGGGPGRDTFVLIYAIFETAFQNLSFGYASTITVVLFGIIVACSLLLLVFRIRRCQPTGPTEEEEAELVAPSRVTLPKLKAVRSFGRASAVAGHGVRRRRVRLPPLMGRIGFGLGAAVLFLFFVAPIAWIALASIQPESAIQRQPPALTLNLWLDGYGLILNDKRWAGSLVVSLLTALFTTFFVILLSAPSAYSLARFDLPGKSLILAILIIIQMVPGIVMAIPVLRIFQILGLTDTVAALVIVNVAFWLPLIVWLLRNFFAEVPIALERAARIDGCSRIGTLFRITVPAARPGIAAAAILLLIGTWNEFLFAVILGNRNAVTITRLITGIQNYPSPINQSPPPNLLAAAAMVAVIPCLLLVLFFHRRIITGLTEGFVKG
ncbi:MAG TPA: ABC transporter permease subunit [Candidatus Limnocylindrales bacterium]|nr:ABC transporter permease subunit [Candidatus Limnocylindrales bacterium]